MSENHLSESIVVEADPATVYAVVSDVTRTGEWSPVCTSAWWEEGGGPEEGSWFGGRNEVPGRTWETRSRVVTADPGREFRWQVGGEYVVWAYLLRAVGAGEDTRTELTETWDLNEATEQMFATKYADRAEAELDQRREQARSGIPATLAAIKRIVESSAG